MRVYLLMMRSYFLPMKFEYILLAISGDERHWKMRILYLIAFTTAS